MPYAIPATKPLSRAQSSLRRVGILVLGPAAIALAGCGAASVTANSTNNTFSISPGVATIDTNCTGCNTTTPHGQHVHQFAATLTNGSAASVTWSVSGGDAKAGAGSINAQGQYTPPSYVTADSAEVTVTARLASNPSLESTSHIAVTPGFLQPLTPQNVAVGANGSVVFSSRISQVGGKSSVHFALSSSPRGSTGGVGTLGVTTCQRSSQAFTSCSVTYTAPAALPATDVTFVVASAGISSSKTEAEILLNTAAINSDPATHQIVQLAPLMPLGSSGGNNSDYDAHGNSIADCCSGTLGGLIQDTAGKQYILSNNHVLARSDHATVGDLIVQPGLIDNNCTPNGDGNGTQPVATLTGWLPLKSTQTNADAALAQVASRAVDTAGGILELGARQGDGTLAPAPLGVSSTSGKGEAASLDMKVAKSGRTTGLTCASVSAIDLDVSVDYFRDCAETKPYLTKTFANQIAVSGDRFGDAGDSGSLILDAGDAEPVGLFFSGGTDSAGVSHAIANPASDVLSELGSQQGTTFSYVGSTDHAVSCLNYGDSTVSSAQSAALSDEEIARAQQGLFQARQLVNPSSGILGVSMGKSSDQPGKAAIIIYIDENSAASVPAQIDGLRTMVIPTTAQAVSVGAAPMANVSSSLPSLSTSKLNEAIAIKRRIAHSWMRQNPAAFGIGIGQSLDNPREVALVIYLDRQRVPAQLPQTVGGLRTRYVIMDRLHVTRSYASRVSASHHCAPPTEFVEPSPNLEPKPLGLN